MRLLAPLALFACLLPGEVFAQMPADPACPAKLFAIADAQAAEAPEADDAACTVATPVKMTAIKVGDRLVQLSGDPVLDCPFALALAQWTRDVAAPLARGELGRELERLGTGTGFQCRRRNRSKTGKLSQHAFGNAVDIVSFEFAPVGKAELADDAKRFDVEPYEDMDADEAGYLDAVRKSACGYFTTILGPGSNAAHADHLHFDLGRSFKDGKRRDNPYRICD